MEQNSILNVKENYEMLHYNKLTYKRKAFINQLYNLVNVQFEEQEKLKDLEPTKIIEELENNPDYIQRIFIDAPWGMGKSFFSKALKEKIEKENEIKEDERKINYININAWETDYFSDPMKSMVGEINSNIRFSQETIDKVEQILKKGLTIFGKAVFYKVLEKVGIDETKRKEIETLFKEVTQFETSELEDYKKYKKLVDEFKECLALEKKLKVIVIDELDRCKPSYAIELLETIKHFFGVKNIIFVFLVNKEQLQSIASTSYLTEDKCSEYFEKFFDIQFNLPELEYEDFIQIEYDKYNQPKTYEVNDEGISEDNIKIYESIFLDAFISNCDSSIVSPRNFIKSFKKFRILLTSLSDEERACYPLMIVLILYFIKEEFFKKNESIDLRVLFKNTFFFSPKKISKNLVKNISGTLIISGTEHELKNNYREDFDFYLIFSKFIGQKNSSSNSLFIQELDKKKEIVYILSNDTNIRFKNLIYSLVVTEYSNNNRNGNIFIENTFFNEKQLLDYQTTKNSYNFVLLEAWAKEKYNFTMNINL